jgi:hypothetical protein
MQGFSGRLCSPLISARIPQLTLSQKRHSRVQPPIMKPNRYLKGSIHPKATPSDPQTMVMTA